MSSTVLQCEYILGTQTAPNPWLPTSRAVVTETNDCSTRIEPLNIQGGAPYLAKLVEKILISLWFVVDIFIYLLWFLNKLITGRHHLVPWLMG